MTASLTRGAPGSNGVDGRDGASAYELALDAGFIGDVNDWLASLVGPAGRDGANGRDGAAGANGTNGTNGRDGAQGIPGPEGPAGPTGLRSWMPTGAITETRTPLEAATLQTITTGATGVMRLIGGLTLPAGEPVSSFSLFSGTTAGAGLTHSFLAVYDLAFNLLCTTEDITTAAWAASTLRTWRIATALRGLVPGGTFTAPDDLDVYLGLVNIGSTMPTLTGANTASALNSLTPRRNAAVTGLTLTGVADIPGPITQPLGGGQTGNPWGYCS